MAAKRARAKSARADSTNAHAMIPKALTASWLVLRASLPLRPVLIRKWIKLQLQQAKGTRNHQALKALAKALAKEPK